MEAYGSDWLSLYPSNPSLVLFPKSQKDVEYIVQWALRYKKPLVPSGGRTGLSGGAAAPDQEVVLSFEKMNQILDFNELDQSLRTQPGVVTKTLQAEALKRGFFFPLSFASEGSSQVGGNVATDAGGVHVIKYGLLRKWVTGLKVVTGEGKTLSLGRGLIKNRVGYDLLQLMIGSEGTLGIITEITFRLAPKPPPTSVFLFALNKLQDLTSLYVEIKSHTEPSAFEMFEAETLPFVEKMTSSSPPFPLKKGDERYYALVECNQSEEDKVLSLFEKASEEGRVQDGVMSENSQQAREFWSFRENISEALNPHHPYKNDISVRPSQMAGFLKDIKQILKKEYPGFKVLCFGHIGDGNLHINVLKPRDMEKKLFLKKCGGVDKTLFSLVRDYGGSVSAEHGVGLLKKPYLPYSCSQEEIHYMKAIKKIFDPQNILNPGKIW